MQSDHETRRILVVDDDPICARIVAHWLAGEGFESDDVSNGAEALNRLAERNYDAVVSDVQMPVVNGFELLQHVHKRFPHLPVILMTAFCEEGMCQAAEAWGAATLLQKPLAREEVLSALSALIHRSCQSNPDAAELQLNHH